MKKSLSGFTIVELLIVIVVIAVLAAISVVAYNGVQQRARDAERSSDLSAMVKKLEVYFIDRGYYPNSAQVRDLDFQSVQLDAEPGIFTSPGGQRIAYCWSNTPNNYCYVATRPNGQTGDCTGAGGADPNEPCTKYRISYRTEDDPNTMKIRYSPNW